jgi:hypothetical protein
MLPDHPACSFIGSVTAPSLVVASLVSSGHNICDEKTNKGEVKLKAIKEVDNEDSGRRRQLRRPRDIKHWLNETLPSTAGPQIVVDIIKQMNPTNKSNFSKDVWELMAEVS